jgi:hypothetical protein
VDPGFVVKGPYLCTADRHGHHHVHFTKTGSHDTDGGSDILKDDDVYAYNIHRDVSKSFERIEPVFSLQ